MFFAILCTRIYEVLKLVFSLSGIMIMFLSAFFFALVCTVFFIIGVTSQRVICDTIRNPEDNNIMKLLEDAADLKSLTGLDVNITSVLTNCHLNESVYKVFQLQSVFNVSELNDYMSKYDIEKALDGLSEQISANTDVTILDAEAVEQLKSLASSGISDINFDKFIEIVSSPFKECLINQLFWWSSKHKLQDSVRFLG